MHRARLIGRPVVSGSGADLLIGRQALSHRIARLTKPGNKVRFQEAWKLKYKNRCSQTVVSCC
jgi:hypothetical protein